MIGQVLPHPESYEGKEWEGGDAYINRTLAALPAKDIHSLIARLQDLKTGTDQSQKFTSQLKKIQLRLNKYNGRQCNKANSTIQTERRGGQPPLPTGAAEFFPHKTCG